MLTDVGNAGFGLGLALTNKRDTSESEESPEELEQDRKELLQKEVDILVNQIGKINQPLG